MVFDMASASMARGEVMVAAREGHAVPPGTGLDRDGQPTTDAQAIIDGGMLLPFGGYKGAGIAMMIELLAAGLIGERFSFEAAAHDNRDGGPPRGGEFLWPSIRRALAAMTGWPIAKAFSPNFWPSRAPACRATAGASTAPEATAKG